MKKTTTVRPTVAAAVAAATARESHVEALLSLYKADDVLKNAVEQKIKAKDLDYLDAADLLGTIREIQKKVKKLEGMYKQLLAATRREDAVAFSTDTYDVEISVQTRSSLDTMRILQEIKEFNGFSDEELAAYRDEHMVEGEPFEVVRTTRRKE